MLFSKYFCPILKENPKDAVIKSHILMIRAGLIRQTSSGIYMWLPMGLRVLENISKIVKEELNKTGALNLLMPMVQNAELWQESGRYDDYGLEMLRIKDRHNRDLLYGPTNEEQITQIFRDNIKSYKDLPLNMYQVQWKFRDEIRPRFGVMRGREFLMKDAYSFDLTEEEAVISYKKMFCSYLKIFTKMGLDAIPVKADTGPIGGDLSHEFLILAETGESEVICDKDVLHINSYKDREINYDDANELDNIFQEFIKYYAATDEKHREEDEFYIASKESIVRKRGIEIGHIFYFADKYSKAMKAQIVNKDKKIIDVLMGSYGIGVSRLVGAIIEASHDDKGIIWPCSVAPFTVIINNLGNSEKANDVAIKLYNYLKNNKIEVLFNDRDESAGVKLNTADLLGIPVQVNIGKRTLEKEVVELKIRKTNATQEIAIGDFVKILEIVKSTP